MFVLSNTKYTLLFIPYRQIFFYYYWNLILFSNLQFFFSFLRFFISNIQLSVLIFAWMTILLLSISSQTVFIQLFMFYFRLLLFFVYSFKYEKSKKCRKNVCARRSGGIVLQMKNEIKIGTKKKSRIFVIVNMSNGKSY